MEKMNILAQQHRQLMQDCLDYIWKNPETGYREWKTHAYLEEAFAKLGYELTLAGDIPGFTAELDTGRPGPTIAVFGEMDSLLCADHPDADPVTGAVHACGHCAQAAALLGIAAALQEPGALDGMCGKIRLVVVPAEELIEIGYRKELKNKGIIRYLGGKPEFLYRGLLDGVDLSFMIHTAAYGPGEAGISGGYNGCIAKNIEFKGVASHAGGSPHLGVNALYAANVALNAINALRETFEDSAHIRVHPIITAGGDAVNAIPNTVKLESYVRGANVEQITKVNQKVNRAIAASAAALGANAVLEDIPGYMPGINDPGLMELMKEAMENAGMQVRYNPDGWGTGCTDMGDMSVIMPTIHPHAGGATGRSHGNDYRIADPETACVGSAKIQLQALQLLLGDDAARAKKIIAEYKPVYASKEEYFNAMDKLNLSCEAVAYAGENKAVLTFGND